MTATTLANLNAVALTGRSSNPFFRREQLKFLHDALRGEVKSIRDALRQDQHVTDAEATIEIATALRHLKAHYEGIDQKAELESEYKPTKAKDVADRTGPWGVVYIEPNLGHTPFFSVVGPLAAAIAAGSCIALKLDNTPRALPSLLRSLLLKALQPDTFQIISTSPQEGPTPNLLSVLQEAGAEKPDYTQLVSSSGRVLAVVDRTADLSSAAEALVAARFSFGGTSPYAPDLVFVNEFVQREFVEQVLKHGIRYLAVTSSNGTPNVTLQPKERNASDVLATLSENKHWQTTIITLGSTGAIVELTNKDTTHVPLPPRLDAPVFAVSAVSSLDHAIDLITNDSDDRLSAAYHFAAPAHAKYLSQFIHAEVTFVNHIPSVLLLGPGAPLFHNVDVENRYRKEQFQRASPVLVRPARTQASTISAGKDAAKLLEDAAKEIKEPKRAESIAIGYFEQGILIGLGVYGVPLLTCLGASLFFGVRAGLRRFEVI
ncbi:ALDH-like protein [Karstenula rhodostoma CBS 690.94]|uniref:ALDH-like protein n=1 Tax=Karstenula rhodostoma CBS 690.94 TaxID=1392251 RepID=A0A9P4UEB6_9PLEO|nr:ALDH-like protein [Karstenula rhodostoma CBS 690.94]